MQCDRQNETVLILQLVQLLLIALHDPVWSGTTKSLILCPTEERKASQQSTREPMSSTNTQATVKVLFVVCGLKTVSKQTNPPYLYFDHRHLPSQQNKEKKSMRCDSFEWITCQWVQFEMTVGNHLSRGSFTYQTERIKDIKYDGMNSVATNNHPENVAWTQHLWGRETKPSEKQQAKYSETRSCIK